MPVKSYKALYAAITSHPLKSIVLRHILSHNSYLDFQ